VYRGPSPLSRERQAPPGTRRLRPWRT